MEQLQFESEKFSDAILDLDFFDQLQFKNFFSDTLESHKLGKLSMIDEAPFIISGYRTFETEKLEGREWKRMSIFPSRDYGEQIAYLYHTSEIVINNEVLLFGGSCGGTCAHSKAFKFNRNKLCLR